MTGFLLFKRSIDAVFRNLDDALAISGLLWIALTAVVVCLSSFAPEIIIEQGEQPDLSPFIWILLPNLGTLLVGIWVAVEWHRFALLGVRPTRVFPQFHMPLIVGYLGKSLKIMALMIGIAFAIILVATLIGTIAGVVDQMLAVVPVISILVVFVVFYRLSPVLPATAIGNPMTLKEAWERTKPIQKEIYQAVFLVVLVTLVAQVPLFVINVEIIALIYSLAVGWVGLMVGVSLLSAIYEMLDDRQDQL